MFTFTADCFNREHAASRTSPRGVSYASVLSHNMFGHFLGRSEMYPLK